MTRAELEDAFEKCLSQVDEQAANSYIAGASAMLARVNRALESRRDLPELIGDNNVESMHSNHAYHVEFMGSLLRTRSASTFVDTVTWFYRSYRGRGFHPEYWLAQMEAWQKAVRDQLGEKLASSVLEFYDLLVAHHSDFLEMSKAKMYETRADPDAMEHYERYLDALLKPNCAQAHACIRDNVKSVGDILFWWQKVIQPAMHEIGRLWAEGKIHVGQEHIATAITQRVTSAFCPMILEQPRDKADIVLTASPGELHEIGPRMVCDLLEIHGWNVYYLGANTPIEGVSKVLDSSGSKILCVSTTLPSNLNRTEKLIVGVRSNSKVKDLHILVGGQAYINDPELWKSIGADGYAPTGQSAVRHLDNVWNTT